MRKRLKTLNRAKNEPEEEPQRRILLLPGTRHKCPLSPRLLLNTCYRGDQPLLDSMVSSEPAGGERRGAARSLFSSPSMWGITGFCSLRFWSSRSSDSDLSGGKHVSNPPLFVPLTFNDSFHDKENKVLIKVNQ